MFMTLSSLSDQIKREPHILSNALWWQRGVVYQVYPRSFQDANDDGVGDLRGVAERLDYVAELGVDALWLNPFYRSPMKDFGYDVSDHCDVDPLFGTLEDFDHLLNEAHKRDLKVIIDFVPNHTSDQHPWFQASRSHRDHPRREWYTWRDPKPNGGPPNNWVSMWGGPAWTFDEGTGQYYHHSFLPSMPDLNWRNPAVKKAMFGVMRFWLERGVDGFRVDAAPLLMKDPLLRDNPPNLTGRPTFEKPFGDYDSQLHLYDQRHSDIHELFREMRRVLDEYSAEYPRVGVGEVAIPDLTEWASYYGSALDELHMPFNFGLVSAPWAADVIARTVRELEANLPPGAWPNWVLGNHDQPRVASRVGDTQARLAMLLLLTLRGTPTLYYGDELGLHDVPIAPEQVQDPWEWQTPGLGLGRDPERAPMPWSEAESAGFTSPGVAPWLPMDSERASVEAQQRDPNSMLRFTKRLLELRRATPALSMGHYKQVEMTNPALFAFERARERQRILVLFNFSDAEQRTGLSVQSPALCLSTHTGRENTLDNRLTLQPHEGLVLELAEDGPTL